jgi:hypothetical protein
MRVLWVVLVAGCWTAPPPQEPIARPPEPPVVVRPPRQLQKSPCERAVENAIEVSRADLEQNTKLKAHIVDVQHAAVESCETLAWPTEALECFQDAVDASNMRTCVSKLTSDQRSDMFRRIDEIANLP